MKQLNREAIRRMVGDAGMSPGAVVVGGSGGSGGGSAAYADEAGHAAKADHAAEATHATAADSATTATTAQNLASDSTDWNKIARKDIAQTIAEVWTFAKGLAATLRSYFNGGATISKASIDTGKALQVTGGTQTDTLDASGNATVGGTLDVTDDLTANSDLIVMGGGMVNNNMSVGQSLTVMGSASVSGQVRAAKMIADVLNDTAFKTLLYAHGFDFMTGKGFGVETDANGKARLQTDDLYVLGKMWVNTLNIREVSYIGGSYLLTPAGSKVVKAVPLYAGSGYDQKVSNQWSTNGSGTVVGYRLYCLADDGTTGTTNYWNRGDQVFCQTFNLTAPGQYTDVENQRYWRLCTQCGSYKPAQNILGDGKGYHYVDVANIATVWVYDANGNQLTSLAGSQNFVGYEDANGSTPKAEDKIVSLGSQYDSLRCGAIQLTAEGEASIGIYDNISDYTPITDREIHYFSKTAVRMTSTKFWWRTGNTLQTQDALVTATNERISTAEQNITRVSKTVRSKNILQYDGWYQDDGDFLGSSYCDPEQQKFTTDGSTAFPYSPIMFLAAGTYVFSAYNAEGTYLRIYTSAENVTCADDMTLAQSLQIDSVVSGDTIPPGYTRGYVSFTLATDCYVSLLVYYGSSFMFVRPQLEVGDTPTTYAPGEHTRFSEIYQDAENIWIGVNNGLTQTGINIHSHKITAKTDNFEIQNNSGVKTFGIDANGNLESIGDASFGGTVRASNLFRGICLAVPGRKNGTTIISNTVYSPIVWQYEGPDYGSLKKGAFYTEAPTDPTEQGYFNGYAVKCIGTADFVNIAINPGSITTYNLDINLPDPRFVPGKLVEITATALSTLMSFTYTVGCTRPVDPDWVDPDDPAIDMVSLITLDSNGKKIYNTTPNIAPCGLSLQCESGRTYRFLSVEGYSSSSAQTAKYVWLMLS